MKFSKKIVFALISIFVLASISGCTTSLTQDKLDKINDRLELIDDFKEQIVLVEPTDSTRKYKSDTFRGIPFGTYRSDVLTLETLPLLNEYTNAVDFASTLMFNYSMTPTYWFNTSDQFYSGSYHMRSDERFDDLSSKMTAVLTGLYGQPQDANYYNFDNEIIPSDSENIVSLINQEKAYYYAWFSYEYMDIELIIEIGIPDKNYPEYDVYVYYSDYSYDS